MHSTTELDSQVVCLILMYAPARKGKTGQILSELLMTL